MMMWWQWQWLRSGLWLGGWQRRQMQMLGLVCSHVTRHNEIPPARFSQMHVLDSGITKLNVVAIGSNAEKKSRLDVPSTIIHHHPPSSTIIHHHPPSSTIIHHHPPSSTNFNIKIGFPSSIGKWSIQSSISRGSSHFPIQNNISKGPLEGPIQSDWSSRWERSLSRMWLKNTKMRLLVGN